MITLEKANIAWRLAATFALSVIGISVMAVAFSVVKTDLSIDKAVAGVAADVHTSAGNIDDATVQIKQSVSDTSKMLNANLIQAEIILDNTRRVTEKEESFWDRFSTKSLATLDHANYFLAGLEDTTKGANIILDQTSKHVDKTLDTLTADVHQNLLKSQATLDAGTVALQEGTLTERNLNLILTGPKLTETLANVQVVAKHIASISDHLDQTTLDIEHKTHTTLYPTKKRQALNFFLDAINVGAHGAEIYYYGRPK